MKVHVFIGQFKTREEATNYTEPQWEPEPDETVSDEEYEKWEDRNPIWKMRTDLNVYLDSDFIETITDGDQFEYLKSLIKNPTEVLSLESQLNSKQSTLVLIFEEAIGSNHPILKSTNELDYMGNFESVL